MTSGSKFYSLEEVADLLGVTYQLIYRLVRVGEMPAIRVGKLYRISQKDLDVFLEQSRISASKGGVCSLCGKTYQSRLSLSKSCIEQECDAPLCVDCWDRKKERYCPDHRQAHLVKGKMDKGGAGDDVLRARTSDITSKDERHK